MEDYWERKPNPPRQIALTIVIVVLLVGAAFSAGVYAGSEGALDASAIPAHLLNGEEELQPAAVNFTPLWKAWNVINEKYVPASSTTRVTDEDKLWGTIQGLARSLDDPYTVFLPPQDAEIFEDDISGNFEGVGMEIGIRDGILTVIAPLKGTPAAMAGLLSGDKIVKINDESTEGITVDKAVKMIRGERGTAVVFTIAREGENEFLEISVTRDVIEIPTIETKLRDTELLEGGIFVIELYNFSAISPHLFRNALRDFIESGADKLILDLRNNPGGFLEASVDIASWFLPTGKVIVTEDSGGNSKPKIHRSKGYNIFNDNLKIAILVNSGSASASEILAGALSQHGVATLVGSKTFGKGSVQELVKITPETSLKLTIARWLTPDGTSISDGGIKPDFEIEITPEDIEADKDPQLDKAVEILLTR
jgi:carboxyl-terminal processing protease